MAHRQVALESQVSHLVPSLGQPRNHADADGVATPADPVCNETSVPEDRPRGRTRSSQLEISNTKGQVP